MQIEFFYNLPKLLSTWSGLKRLGSLFLQGLKKDSLLDDETGKPVPALDVFALSIQCLKDKLMTMLNNEGTGKHFL